MIETAEEALKHVSSGAAIMARFDKGFPYERHLLYFEDYRDFFKDKIIPGFLTNVKPMIPIFFDAYTFNIGRH